MLVDPDGLLLAFVVCGALCFMVGWMGSEIKWRTKYRDARSDADYFYAECQRLRESLVQLGKVTQQHPNGVLDAGKTSDGGM